MFFLRNVSLSLVIFLCCFTAQSSSLSSAERLAVIQNVYDKIYAATGNPELKPAIILDTYQKSQIAYIKKDNNGRTFIGFEDEAFTVCESFGPRRDDAIAYILGHELSHHLLKHSWSEEFGSSFSVKSLSSQMKEIDRMGYKKFEAQADERGGILCYMAGYNVKGLSELLLRNLYSTYNIEESPKYPSLEERIKIAVQQDSIIGTYIQVFEVGNYAMMLSDYRLAISCYEYIVSHSFHSREIYNNIGVAYFNLGIEENPSDAIGFYYPVGIDLEGKLKQFEELKKGKDSHGTNKGNGTGSHSNNGGLKDFGDFITAIQFFDKAIQFDPDYPISYLNKGACLTLLHRFDEAESALKMAKVLSNGQDNTILKQNTQIVQSILSVLHLNYKKEQPEFADEIELLELKSKLELERLNALAEQNIPYALLNLEIINGRKDFYKSNVIYTHVAPKEIHGLYKETEKEATSSIQIGGGAGLYIFEKANSTLYALHDRTYRFYYFKPLTEKGAVINKKELKNGMSIEEVRARLGEPLQIVSNRQGLCYHYPEYQVLVLTDASQKVTSVILYSISDLK